MTEPIALLALLACLASAIARSPRAPEWVVATGAALLLALIGAVSPHEAGRALRALGPTVAFLAALLVVAGGCARAGLFEAVGGVIARRSVASPRRLLGLVFASAALTTAVLSLDATVLLLTPVVLATAARMRVSPRPHLYACSHLANSASLLLPVSNLTNLLAFSAAGISFLHFAALMALPWLAALVAEWVVLARVFARELGPVKRAAERPQARDPDAPWPGFAAAVVALALIGFACSSAIGVAPVWFAAGAAAVLVSRYRMGPHEVLRAVSPGFLLFVLALGVVVRAASEHGLSDLLDHVVPHSSGLASLLVIAAIAAVAANLLNNLPATLMLVPAVAATGHGAVLAMLIGVGVGPNLTYTGSLATLLWRGVLHGHDQDTNVIEFVRLGALTVPAALLICTLGLWLALQLLG